MGAILEVGSATGGTLGLSNTSFYTSGDSSLSPSNSSFQAQLRRRTAGTFTGLYVRLLTNTITATSSATIWINSATGTETVSITASTAGEYRDTLNSDTVTAGQPAEIRVVTGATGTTLSLGLIGLNFADSSLNTTKRLTNCSASGVTLTTTQKFMALVGSSGGSAGTEATTQFTFQTAGTLKNLLASISSNTATKTTTIVSRINTAPGAQTISIATTASGVFEDTTNTDTISSGTLANYGLVVATGGSGTCSLNLIASEFTTTNGITQMIAGDSSTVTQATSLTRYTPAAGLCNTGGGAFYTTESNIQALAQAPYTLSLLGIHVTANTVTAASALNFRKNAGPGNQAVSITASTAGYFGDATHSDTVLATDEINYQLVTGGTGTSLSATMMGTVIAIPSGVNWLKESYWWQQATGSSGVL